MNWIYFNLVFVLFPLLFHLNSCDFKLSGKRFDCTEINPYFFTNISCQIKLLNRHTQLYSADIRIIEGLSVDWVHVRIRTFYKYNSVKYHPIMVDLEEDLCGFFSGFVGAKLIAIFAEQWKKYGNFVQPCPMKGHIYIHNMTLDEQPFPPVLPNGDWKIEFRFFGKIDGKTVTAFVLTVVAEIKSKGASENFR